MVQIRDLQPDGMGSAVLVRWEGHYLAITCAHVLEQLNSTEPRHVQLFARNQVGSTTHHRKFIGARGVGCVNGVWSDYDHLDIAAIEVEPADATSRGFSFLTLTCETEAQVDDEVCFLSRPASELTMSISEREQYPDLQLEKASVVFSVGRLLCLSAVSLFGASPSIDLRGSSGSGIFSSEGQLLGTLWGGCANRRELYATTVQGLLEGLQMFFC